MSTKQIEVDADYMITAYNMIPYAVISEDIAQYKRNDFFAELGEIIGLYNVYKSGAKLQTEGSNGDYAPSNIRYKKIKTLVDKEARFLFSKTPDIVINLSSDDEASQHASTQLNDYVTKVFNSNNLSAKLVKAAKDCFIGKRVAIMLNFSNETGVSITFLTALEFIYEMDEADRMSKFSAFYTVVDTSSRKDRRVKKKIYAMHDDGFCYVHELLYDGLGDLVEELLPEQRTEFQYIPACVILNDGLTNESTGESEVAVLDDYEKSYSRLANADVDAERKSMNPTKYTIDAAPESTTSLSTAPGAYWDLHSNEESGEPHTACAGVLEPQMSYSGPLKTTLDRIDNMMYGQVDVPNINSEQLQGVITSGKTIGALYWGLTVRCDEKMLAWSTGLKFLACTVIDGARLYPQVASLYMQERLPDVVYEVSIVNHYPLPEDEQEEKTMDLSEVTAQTMSRKAYMKKWRNLTDKEAEAELEQITTEKQMFEDSYIPTEAAESSDLQ